MCGGNALSIRGCTKAGAGSALPPTLPRSCTEIPALESQTMEVVVRIIGAGLAGCEAAWQCARRGVEVELCEMRPVRSTPAHQTADFAELVCSNSLKSDSENTAPWLLKEEMRRAQSLLLQIARECAVPAGHALAVDRVTFAAKVTEAISRESRITVRRGGESSLSGGGAQEKGNGNRAFDEG